MKVLEKAVMSKTAPEHKDVLWIDTKEATPELKVWNRGRFEKIGGGSGDAPIGNGVDIDQDENGKLQFANRVNGANTTGMGYVVLKKNKTFAEQVTGSNTIYEIRDSFDLGGSSFTIPTGCVLYFNGGQVNNGILVGTNTKIQSDLSNIFGVTLSGTWTAKCVFPEWFGAKGDGVTDDSNALIKCVSAPIKDVILTQNYLLTQTISVTSSKNIRGNMQLIKASNVEYAFDVTGSNVEICGLKISGENTSIGGIKITNPASGVYVHDCEFYGFYSSIASGGQANGVYVHALCSDITLKALNIHHIDAEKNGVVGDVPGSCQGILIGKVTNCIVDGCYIHDINDTEDGEGIQVYSSQVDGKWTTSDVTIRNCYIYNVAKRMIKAQCSDITIDNCVLVRDDDQISVSRGISLFGENCIVKNCYINALDESLIATPALNTRIVNCEIINQYSATKQNTGNIYVYGGDGNCLIKGNKISGGGWASIYIDPSSVPSVQIQENMFEPTILFGIRSIGTSKLVISDNLFMSSNSVRFVSMNLDSDKIITGNVFKGGLYGIFNASSSVSESKIENNVFSGFSQADVYDQVNPKSLGGGQIRRSFAGDALVSTPKVGDTILWSYPTECYSKVRCFDNKWRRIPLISDFDTHGATTDRPSAALADVGFTYFDTDLGKMIVSNGSAWVNMDGSALNP